MVRGTFESESRGNAQYSFPWDCPLSKICETARRDKSKGLELCAKCKGRGSYPQGRLEEQKLRATLAKIERIGRGGQA